MRIYATIITILFVAVLVSSNSKIKHVSYHPDFDYSFFSSSSGGNTYIFRVNKDLGIIAYVKNPDVGNEIWRTLLDQN